ncbi:MAG: S8 family serine peptidase [Burkholderiales bacterium]|nr:S8 family serine peptidase [Burkholderiales bacterium]
MAVLATAPVFAQVSVPVEAAENGRLWFVELIGAPSIEGRATRTVRADQAAFRAAAAKAGLTFAERRSYSTLFNGFAISINPNDRAKFARLPGVKAMHPIEVVQAPTPEEAAGSAMDLATALSLTGANVAQNTYGLSGKNIKVGIIDTGIDIDHPAFGGTGVPGTTPFPSARVITGYDFVGDAFNSGGSGAALVPVPDANPDDCNGHGTHVSGIVGGNGGGIKGVAPDVKFGAYRVFGCVGSTTSDIILAALERAYADGMQVINQSLGAARQWPQYPTAQASSRLVNKGVVMVASIGNNGPGGSSPDALFAAGAPGVGKDVVGVASFDNAQRAFSVNGTPYGYTPASGAPLPPTSGSLTMAKTGTTATANDACAALPAGSLAGKAVLIRRGTCSFFIKASNAQNAGAAAVVLYNNAAGALAATVAGTPAITIPVVGITQAQGATLDAAIAGGPTTLSWTTDVVSFPFGTGGLISGFSSFGLAADLSFKPDVGAPGGGIFSSYPLELGGGATLSGTSMSSPHVAGAAALILEKAPVPANLMAAVMQNNSQPKPWSGNPGLGFLDFTFRQGGGMLDIPTIINANAFVTPSDLAVGDSDPTDGGPFPRTITVDNQSGVLTKWTITHEPALASGPNVLGECTAPCALPAAYGTTGTFSAPADVVFDKTEVITPSRGIGTFVVTITPNPGLPDRSLYGGYIKLTSESGKVLRIPYAGFKGDYQSTRVLTGGAGNGFPWLAQVDGTSFANRPSGATYTLAGDDIPFFLIHLDHLSRRVYLEVRNAVTGQIVGKVSDDEYMTRNSTPGGFFSFAWDGVTFKGNPASPKQVGPVPNGQYVVTVWVLKALGTDFVPAHWESWTSPVVTIARP